MKKLVVCVLLVAVLASSAFAWEAAKQKALGQDANKMTWYLLDYGKDDAGNLYAVSRKYYTNQTVKNETIELLMSKFGISPEVAGSLYFTEYGYGYTDDGKQFTTTYVRHYDMLGNLIHGTDYDEADRTYTAVSAVNSKHAVAQGAAYAQGKTPTTTATKTTTTKKSSVPSSRVVRKGK